MLEIAIAEKLMAVRAAHGARAQQRINTIYDAAITGDYALAEDLNPEMPEISKTVHDTQIAFGSMMAGSEIEPEEGLNPIEVIETMLKKIQGHIQIIMQMGGVGSPMDIIGFGFAEKYTNYFIMQLAQDKQQKARVKEYKDALGKMMNEVKGFQQRQQQAAQQAQGQNGGDPKDAAKAKAMVISAQMKSKLASESHAQKTVQRQLQFEQQQKQDAQKHQLEMQKSAQEGALDLTKKRVNLFDEE
jgi:hypothetical protein